MPVQDFTNGFRPSGSCKARPTWPSPDLRRLPKRYQELTFPKCNQELNPRTFVMQTSLGEAWLKAILRLRAGTCSKRTVNAYKLVEQKRRNVHVRSEPKAFVPSPRIGTARHTQAEIHTGRRSYVSKVTFMLGFETACSRVVPRQPSRRNCCSVEQLSYDTVD